MNLSTLALILLAWQLLYGGNSSQNTQQPPPKPKLTDFLSEDTKNMMNCVDKLSSQECSQEDKTSAIFQMLSNPAVMNLASNMFGGFGKTTTKQPDESERQQQNDENADVNSEGYRFETPSKASQEFFRPIDNIADEEIKHKLYWFYDNWYVK